MVTRVLEMEGSESGKRGQLCGERPGKGSLRRQRYRTA